MCSIIIKKSAASSSIHHSPVHPSLIHPSIHPLSDLIAVEAVTAGSIRGHRGHGGHHSPSSESALLFSDLNEAIPETELLDNSIQKGRAQLSVKARRQRPSRSRYRDSVSSTEGEDSLERKVMKPLECVRRSPEDGGASLAAPPRGRYHQLTNATSQEPLVMPSSSPSRSCPSSECSPVYLRRSRRPEILVSDTSRDTSPVDHGSSTVVFDKKTKRRFLDLGNLIKPTCKVYLKKALVLISTVDVGLVRLVLSQHCYQTRIKPVCSVFLQESALSEEYSPPHTSSSTSPPVESSSSRSSHPYHTLSQSSDEPCEEPPSLMSSWTTQQVCQWLQGLNMEKYVPEFSARDIDGQELLQLDGNKLKGLGVLSSSDRSALKRRIKDVQSAAEKEKKALNKLEKQKEKQRRKEQEQRRT
uniref:SAM domain-containing protein n=1 Tax=Salarias fasciatus TaxID=181472 RepID=A0A672GNF2_SALFA